MRVSFYCIDLSFFTLSVFLFRLHFLLALHSIIPFASALRSSAPSGVLQLDSFGRPVHLSGPGLIWNVPTSSPVGLRGASTPFSPSVALPDSMEPNLHYGTLQLKDGTVLDRSPAIPIPSPSEGLPATGAVPPSAAAAAYEEIPPAQLATGSMPNVSQRAVPPQAAPLSPLPLLPMQPLAVAAIPTFDPAAGVGARATSLNRVLGSLRTSGLPALDLPEFSLPMLQLRLPWALKEAAIQQTKESAAIAPPKDEACDRDYLLQCPSGWKAKGSDECTAPSDYAGGCPYVLRVAAASTDAKHRMETECRVNWPCKMDRCDQLGGRDYTHECPRQWIYTGVCVAPQSYSGHCDTSQNLSGYTAEQKADFAAACRAEWPCRNEACAQDFTHTCPEGWSFKTAEKICQPPPSYKGGYRDSGELAKMAAGDRLAVGIRWALRWPCAEQTAEIVCEEDYSGPPCPVGWRDVMGSGVCEAPPGYSASAECPNKRHFDFLSAEERRDIANECKLRWPCLGQAPQDCSQCPKGWRRMKEKKGWCEPGPSYTGLCRAPQHWEEMSALQKDTIKKVCEVECQSANNWEVQQGPGVWTAALKLIEGAAPGTRPTLE